MTSEVMPINFSDFDVCEAFTKLFAVCQENIKVSNEEFEIIRNACLARASKPLSDSIRKAEDINHLFEILADNSKYCNWMNVIFLKVIAIACHNDHLLSLIKNYVDVIYSKPLREVWDLIQPLSVKDKYYSEVKDRFGDKDPGDITVIELMKNEPQLAKEISQLVPMIQYG